MSREGVLTSSEVEIAGLTGPPRRVSRSDRRRGGRLPRMARVSTPLDVDALRSRLVGPYASVDFTPSTPSTNADLVKAAADGVPDRTVLIADEQTAGQGR